MNHTLIEHTYIDQPQQLEQFAQDNANVPWMAFDTEFIGEKRYYTLLCLIQVATEHGNYLIDALALDDLGPLLDLLQDEKIRKITHAGENDFRIFYQAYGILPKNVFDTQIAAGFVGHHYPVSFQKLMYKELQVRIPKSYTVSNWEKRPIVPKQTQYALNDVIYLFELYEKLSRKIEKKNRMLWVMDECSRLEKAKTYTQDPFIDALNNNIIHSLDDKGKAFVIRLYEWRRSQAERKNYSKEMILANKYIAPIVRNIKAGKNALKDHRRIPDFVLKKHWNTFQQLYNEPIAPDIRHAIDSLEVPTEPNAMDDSIMEILLLVLKIKCADEDIAPDLILNRTEFKKLKADSTYESAFLEKGWRRNFIGDELLYWLRNRGDVRFMIDQDRVLMERK